MKYISNTITTVNVNGLNSSHISGERRSTLIFVTLTLIFCSPLQIGALQYDLWFKYPHPYTPTEPVNYCSKSVATSAAWSHQSSDCHASTLPVYINALDSPKTFIPYSIVQILDFCDLEEAPEFDASIHTSWDDHIKLAPFDIKWLQKDECKILCKKKYEMSSPIYAAVAKKLAYGLKRDYYHHWFADTLPFSWCYKFNVQQQYSPLKSIVEPKECTSSFPIGYTTDDRGLPVDERVPIGNFSRQNAMFLYNHFDFTIYYESGEGKSWSGKLGSKVGRVTNLRITPRSINHEADGPITSSASNQSSNSSNVQQVDSSACSAKHPPLEIPYQNYNATMSIIYSYSVDFVEDDPANGGWERRWHRLEAVLSGMDKAKWIAALVILLLIATSIPAAYAIARTIFADRVLIFVNPRDEGGEEAAWKTLAGDIFREPSHAAALSVLVGGGCQFILLALLTEIFSVFIPLFPAALLVFLLLLFVLLYSFVGGFVAIRIYRTFGGERWPTVCCFVALLNPIQVTYPLFIARDELLVQNGSLLAMNFGAMPHIFVFAFSFALAILPTLVGGNIAFRMASIAFPVRPAANQRILLEPIVWRHPAVTIALLAFLPMICIWSFEAYPIVDNGGYFITVITILIVICFSISHCYLHLSQYDYRWWWRPYLVGGLAATYYVLYSVYYLFNTLYVDSFVEAVLYIIIQFISCFAIFLLIGTIGFAITFVYLWHTYARTNPSPDMNYAMFQKDNQVE